MPSAPLPGLAWGRSTREGLKLSSRGEAHCTINTTRGRPSREICNLPLDRFCADKEKSAVTTVPFMGGTMLVPTDSPNSSTSFPHTAFVELDPVASEQRTHFVLGGHFAMVRFPSLEVSPDCVDTGRG